MAEVKFKRKSTSEIASLPVDDGSFIVDYESGSAYIDYDTERVQISGGGSSGGGESLPVGTELDYDGSASNIPDGWEQVDDVPTYSTTTETVCGTWIDGKTIYMKVIEITSGFSSSFSYDISSLRVDTLVDIEAGVTMTTGGSLYKNRKTYYTSNDDYFNCFERADTIQFRMPSVVYGNASKVTIILKYTKLSS